MLKNQRGDTIVEVLIAIAIISLTLAGAYTSTNRSANMSRTAQERGEALKWAETQIEQIKATSTDLSGKDSFCFDSNLTLKQGSDGCLTTNPVPYKAIITQSTPGSFKVLVTWDSLDPGIAVNNVELDYKK